MDRLRIAMLHLAPRLGELEHNRRLLEMAVTTAANMGADWAITPELCLSGYQFVGRMGTDWIVAQPDAWMIGFRRLVAQQHLTVFLAHAERDPGTGKLHNSVFVLGPDGSQLGSYRKVQVVPVAEAWASAGEAVAPIDVGPVRVGILICADAYSPRLASLLRAQGAELRVSPAAWPPLPHAPQDSWEARTRETGLPLFVCNRGGSDESMCFDDAQSVVVQGGRRLFEHCGSHSSVLTVDWDLERRQPVGADFCRATLDDSGAATLDWPGASTSARRRKIPMPRHSFDKGPQ
jgi:predicted amidohydrolase